MSLTLGPLTWLIAASVYEENGKTYKRKLTHTAAQNHRAPESVNGYLPVTNTVIWSLLTPHLFIFHGISSHLHHNIGSTSRTRSSTNPLQTSLKFASIRMDTSDSTTDETSSRILKDFFTTDRSKAFLKTYGTNYRNFDKAFFNTANKKSRQAHKEANDQIDPPHIDINFPSPNQKTQTSSEWYGTRLAKQQAYQEQRVFANRQCVRFGFCGDCSSTSSNNYGNDKDDESEDDEDDNNDDGQERKNHEEADTKQPWQFSQLAKNFSAKEQKLFQDNGARIQGDRRRRRGVFIARFAQEKW